MIQRIHNPIKVKKNNIIRFEVALKNPFSIVSLPVIAKIHRVAFRPRKRFSKKLIGRPAKHLFRILLKLGLNGTGVAKLQNNSSSRIIKFRGINTQFGALYMPQNLPVYEPETSALLLQLIQKDDVFFDVGSNWGWYSILVANQPQFCGKVHAFEPHPQNYSDLKSITQQCNFDKVVTCHNLALAEKPGVGKMAFSDGIQNGLARLGKFGVHVNLEMLDNLSLPKPQIIKIDAEDHELGVLLGAENIVKNCQPFIIIENWLHNDNPQKTLSPLKFLIDFDYNFFVLGWVSEDSNCIRLESSTYSELALVPFIIEQRFQLPNQLNIFAVPSQKIDELHTRLS